MQIISFYSLTKINTVSLLHPAYSPDLAHVDVHQDENAAQSVNI